MVLAKRVIPCLDVKDGRVVKGVQFREHEDIGDICTLAEQYCRSGADELVFYDITASADGRTVDNTWIERVAKVINIPFCVAGGIRSVVRAKEILNRGADKISINSPALENPTLISDLSQEFGVQCVVIGIDSFESPETPETIEPSLGSKYLVRQYTGVESKMRNTKWETLDWAREAVRLGAGEIVLNCMNLDGMRSGYDIAQLKALTDTVTVPVVASGGAGHTQHFIDLFTHTGATGALAASIFHKGILSIQEVKAALYGHGISVRI